MKWNLLAASLAIALFLTNADSNSQPLDATWELQLDEAGIRVYTGRLEGSRFAAVRAVTTMQAQPSELVAVLQDEKVCPQWADLCAEAFTVNRISSQEYFLYMRNDVPWPASDRDALWHTVWNWDSESNTITMSMSATSDQLEKVHGVVRLTDAIQNWYLIPLPNGQIEVINEAHIDPGGPIPAWIINRLLVDSPFKTMSNLRRLIANRQYVVND